MTFPNPPVATMRVCRITQRDFDQRGNGDTFENFRSWWSHCHRW
jgi:hypothetical protein